jgi:hypothetical protein
MDQSDEGLEEKVLFDSRLVQEGHQSFELE